MAGGQERTQEGQWGLQSTMMPVRTKGVTMERQGRGSEGSCQWTGGRGQRGGNR